METTEKYSPHYVYLHRTLSGGIPFYIGIGTKQYGDHENPKMKYARAYSITGRTNFWKRIVAKYDYIVEILVESTDYEYIKQQEIFFIQKYGRRDLKKGTLCNLADGGEGSLGVIHSPERKARDSITRKKMYQEGNSPFAKPGFYDGLSERMKGNTYAKGSKLTKEQITNLTTNRIEKIYKRVIQEDLAGNFIKEWHVTREAADHYGISYKSIWNACKKYYKGATSCGFKWRFKE